MQHNNVFILLLICCHNVLCSKRICDFGNDECSTFAASKKYEEFVNGYLDGLPSSDPLFVDVIKADTASVKHTKYNVTLSGMRHCDTELLKLNINDKTGQYHLVCKHLIVEGQYDVKGEINTNFLEGKGYFKENLYNYGLLFSFHYGLTSDKTEIHLVLKQMSLKLDPRDRMDYDFNNNNKQFGLGHGITNEDLKIMEDSAHPTIMRKLLDVFAENINIYLKLVSINHILNVDF